METTKWAKRIAALGTGALMLGATLGGALAVSDLANYPKPFVMNGMLDDTVIVVGKAAKTEDVLGAVDIAAALQAEAVSKVAVTGTAATAPSASAGTKIEKSGNKFNYDDQVTDIQPNKMDGLDLDFLEDGTFEDSKGTNKDDRTYKQELMFGNTDQVLELVFAQPADNDNYEDGLPAGSYLKIVKNKDVYNYTLTFDTAVAIDASACAADLEGNVIEIQGNTYTITEVSCTSNLPSKITMVSGDSTVWLVQDQPYTVGAHTITVADVDSGQTKCGVNVDGVTKWVDDGSTEVFGDLSVGVLDVIAVNSKDYAGDTCQLTLGSNELVLEGGEAVRVNGAELDGSTVTINTGSATWTGFVVTYKDGEDSGIYQDDVFLSPGQAWTDPVFGNFKIQYEGVTGTYETMKLESSSDDATFTFVNNDGVEVDIPFHYDSTNGVYLGTDSDEQLLLPGETYSADPEKTMLLYTTSGGEAHVLELTDVTCASSTNKTTIKDLTYGNKWEDLELTKDCANQIETLSLGSLGQIKLNLTASSVHYNRDATMGAGDPESRYEGNFTFTDHTVAFTEKLDVTAVKTIAFNISYDATTDEEMKLGTFTLNGATLSGWVDSVNGDDDEQWYYTPKGSLLSVDQKDDTWFEIQHPEADVYGNVFVTPLDATFVSGASGGSTADKVNPFTVGLAVLDDAAASMSKNMIVVGGPCANSIAASVMGNPTDCAADFESGKAKLKFFDRNGKSALLVAGYRAEDTRGAAYVLADHSKYALSGSEVEVVVASLSDIQVNRV